MGDPLPLEAPGDGAGRPKGGDGGDHAAGGAIVRPVPAPATRFNLVTLFVRDLQRSVRFYRDVMGLHTRWDGKAPYVEFDQGRVRFALCPRSTLTDTMTVDGTDLPARRNGTFALSLMAHDPALVDAEYERVVGQGVVPVYAPRDEPWGVRSAMVEDPDQNLVEIAAWLAEAAG